MIGESFSETFMGSAADWHAFLDEYRAFGGKAENVMQRKGAFGLGLFPIDPSKPIELLVPDHLLVPVDQVDIEDGNLLISDSSSFPEGYGDWFARYQRNYSWGAEGRENILEFEQGLKDLPDSLKQLLKRNGICNPEARFRGDDVDKEILRRFMQTRCINRNGARVIMPIIDLLNHSPSSKGYEMKDQGIAVSGMHDGEILVRYSNTADPLTRLFGYGFNSLEPLAFSLRCVLQHNDQTFLVQGGSPNQKGGGPFKPCEIEKEDDRLIIKQPLLGAANSPKLPKTLFIQACNTLKEVDIDAVQLFEQIHQRNSAILINLLNELNEVDGEVVEKLKKGCLNQLLALSMHFGQRDDLLNASETPSTSGA